MPLSSILVGLAMALAVVPFVAGPLMKKSDRRRAPAKEEAAPPEAAKQQALRALRDLDFDFRTGKVTQEDYLPLRQRLLVQAAAAVEVVRPAQDDEIEAAVRALRGAQGRRAARTCPECRAAIRAADKFCPTCGAALGLTCPACHAVVQAADQFCGHCGKTLKPEVVAVT